MSPSDGASEPRVRVLQVVETLDVGGMERMIATLCHSLDPARFDVRVLVSKRVGAIGEHLIETGIPVECAHVRFHPPDYLVTLRLLPFIRRFRPDVVHTHATHALLYGGLAAAWSGVHRHVHTEHGRSFPDRPHLMLAERWLSRRLVRYVAVSDALADNVHRFQRIPTERITVIPNGVADLPEACPQRLESLRKSLLAGRPGPVVGLAARLVPEKGLDTLLNAWALLKRDESHSGAIAATLLIVGEGPERQRLESLARALGVSDSVRMPGTLLETAEFFRLLDAFVLSSVSEGLPMALLEAMAAGLPIAATRVGGVPVALEQGNAGVLVPAGDSAALASAIWRIIQPPADSGFDPISLGARARRRFLTKYTAAIMSSRYADLYAPIMKGAPDPC